MQNNLICVLNSVVIINFLLMICSISWNRSARSRLSLPAKGHVLVRCSHTTTGLRTLFLFLPFLDPYGILWFPSPSKCAEWQLLRLRGGTTLPRTPGGKGKCRKVHPSCLVYTFLQSSKAEFSLFIRLVALVRNGFRPNLPCRGGRGHHDTLTFPTWNSKILP